MFCTQTFWHREYDMLPIRCGIQVAMLHISNTVAHKLDLHTEVCSAERKEIYIEKYRSVCLVTEI